MASHSLDWNQIISHATLLRYPYASSKKRGWGSDSAIGKSAIAFGQKNCQRFLYSFG